MKFWCEQAANKQSEAAKSRRLSNRSFGATDTPQQFVAVHVGSERSQNAKVQLMRLNSKVLVLVQY